MRQRSAHIEGENRRGGSVATGPLVTFVVLVAGSWAAVLVAVLLATRLI